MSFRIYSSSPEIQRELESKMAELQSQLDDGFEYEITVESLPREQALESAEGVAEQLGANSIFLSVGLFPVEHTKLVEEEDPDFAMGLPAASDEKRTADQNRPSATPPQGLRSPRIDAQKIKEAAAAKASQARATLQRAGQHATSSLKAAGERTGEFAEAWASRTFSAARVHGSDLRSRFEAKWEQCRASLADWSARRQRRRDADMKARKERQRAAHREAELAAISAQIMLERQKSDDKARAAAEPRFKPEAKPISPPAARNIEREGRDMWPVWRRAFVAAACLALIGVFLLAGGGKQSSASPATSTELSKPATIVPAHTVEQPKVQPVVVRQAAETHTKAAAKPPAPKRLASVRGDGDAFEEVTVRNYTIAPPKKNAKGVVQITDEE